MPQPPNVDGLPDWLKIVVTLVFGAATLFAVMRGYKNGPKETASGGATTTIAHLADMGAVRHLSDVCHNLDSDVVALERQISELTHFTRAQIEIEREVCQRLRELRESMDRHRPD